MAGLGFCATGAGCGLEETAALFATGLAPTCFVATTRLCQCDCLTAFLTTTPEGAASFRAFCGRAGDAGCLPTADLTIPACAAEGFADARSVSSAGFTPAAMAALVAAGESAGWRAVPCRSGFTMICRS